MKNFYKIFLRMTLPIVWVIALVCTAWTMLIFSIPAVIAMFVCWTITGDPRCDVTLVWTIIPLAILFCYMDWLEDKKIIKRSY